VYDGTRGQADARDLPQQMSTASCLVLILTAIVYWQITEMDRVLRPWNPHEEDLDPFLLTHISPIGWDNVRLYGECRLDRTHVRPPRTGSQDHAQETWCAAASSHLKADALAYICAHSCPLP
jgi:hypothetical protein